MKAVALHPRLAPSAQLRPLLGALNELGPRHLVVALAWSLVLLLMRGPTVLHLSSRGLPLLPFFSMMLVQAGALVLAIVVADAYVRSGVRPLVAYATAIGTAASLAPIAAWRLSVALGYADGPFARALAPGMLYGGVLMLVHGGFAALAWREWRERESAARRLRTLELRRADAERQTQEKRLHALQARVEPELLFAALKRVEELTGSGSNERAQVVLDALIALLRFLMPRDGRAGELAASTVERELSTAIALLRLHDAIADRDRPLDLAVAADASRQTVPPMLLLPIVRSIARRDRAGRLPLRLRADLTTSGLALAIAEGGRGGGPLLDAAEVVALRQRLDTAFGPGAARVEVADDPAALTLRLPLHALEPADRADR